jgi:hypothetical protein
MNLSLLKELEDAKAELSKANKQLSDLITKRTKIYLENAVKDFKSFFTEKGFQIQDNSFMDECVATYGNLQVVISIPKPEDSFIGAYSRIDMKIKGYTQKVQEYLILINELGHYPSISAKFTTAPKTEEERIRRQIEDIKEKLVETNERLADFDETKWGYGFCSEEDKSEKYPQYETFKQLLEVQFK